MVQIGDKVRLLIRLGNERDRLEPGTIVEVSRLYPNNDSDLFGVQLPSGQNWWTALGEECELVEEGEIVEGYLVIYQRNGRGPLYRRWNNNLEDANELIRHIEEDPSLVLRAKKKIKVRI